MKITALTRLTLALLLFALPAAFAAMITFERLQYRTIDHYQAMAANLGPYGARTMPTAEIARYTYRLYYAGGFPGHGRAGGTVFYSRLPWIARTKLPFIAAFLAGSLLVSASLWALSYLPRVLPFAASRIERLWAVCGAMRAAWPWSLTAAVLVAGLAWYVGFDRDGTTGPLEQRLEPRRVQLACLVAGWCLVSLMACAVLLPRSLAKIVGPALSARVLCQRCGYPLIGLAGRRCPECGGPGESAQWPKTRRRVWKSGIAQRALVGLTVTAVLISGVAAMSSRARDWLLLRPQVVPELVLAGWLAHGEVSQSWQSVYGLITISAIRREPLGSKEPVWNLDWTFLPAANFQWTAATTGTMEVPISPGSPQQPDLHWRELPCGVIAFYSIPHDSRLHVLSPGVFFYDLGNSARPIPPP